MKKTKTRKLAIAVTAIATVVVAGCIGCSPTTQQASDATQQHAVQAGYFCRAKVLHPGLPAQRGGQALDDTVRHVPQGRRSAEGLVARGSGRLPCRGK